MSKIKVLDCTLRDGGYINNFDFGIHNIKNIVNKFVDAKIDIVEIGFFEDGKFDINQSMFSKMSDFESLIPKETTHTDFVAMTRLNYLDLKNLPDRKDTLISGIRITFHIHEIEEAMEYCRIVKEKGYNVFVQPVGTTSYTDIQLLELINFVNVLQPYAFYYVDTLGLMTKKDIHRVLFLIDHNLNDGIHLGFHSHNNLQLSLSNAQEMMNLKLNRTIIIDSSVHGMGRGAGNLHTELITQYINSTIGDTYVLDSILDIVDNYIANARIKYEWGYSIPYYLAATKNCHPSYASYLIDKRTIDASSISSILENLPEEKRDLYDKKIIEKLYFNHQNNNIDDKSSKDKLYDNIKEKNIMLIVPGKSIDTHRNLITEYIGKNKPVIISVNFIPDFLDIDYAFYSNSKRFHSDIIDNAHVELLLTSNIRTSKDAMLFNYSSYLNDLEEVKDNATLMLLNLLKSMEKNTISICGFDGYNIDAKHNNYELDSLETDLSIERYKKINKQISSFVMESLKNKEIVFLTPTSYIKSHSDV